MTHKPLALYWLASPLEADLVRMVLNRAGFDPVGVSEIASFNQVLTEKHPSFIVLDIVLPGQNGLELMKAVKADKAQAAIPVILISALAFADVVVQARKAGAADFFVKPLDADLLYTRASQFVKFSLSD